MFLYHERLLFSRYLIGRCGAASPQSAQYRPFSPAPTVRPRGDKPRAPGCREPNPLRGFGPAGFHPMALLPAFAGGWRLTVTAMKSPTLRAIGRGQEGDGNGGAEVSHWQSMIAVLRACPAWAWAAHLGRNGAVDEDCGGLCHVFAMSYPASFSVLCHRHSGRGRGVLRHILARKNASPAGGDGHWSGR